MNYFMNKHNKQTQMKLWNLKNKTPKEYWKKKNKCNSVDNKKQESNISTDKLYTFFRGLYLKMDSDELLNSSLEDNDVIFN